MVEDTDIVKQTKYSAECFKTGELPDPDFIEKLQIWKPYLSRLPIMKII